MRMVALAGFRVGLWLDPGEPEPEPEPGHMSTTMCASIRSKIASMEESILADCFPYALFWITPGNSALACRGQGPGDDLMKLATSRQLRRSITFVNLHTRQAVFCKHLNY